MEEVTQTSRVRHREIIKFLIVRTKYSVMFATRSGFYTFTFNEYYLSEESATWYLFKGDVVIKPEVTI